MVTKFHIPQSSPGLVIRPSLIERLSRGLSVPLTLVVAPAGFGKTTAVIQWLNGDLPGEYAGSVYWLSVDERENSLSDFWFYFISSLQQKLPGLGKVAVNVLKTSPDAPIENILISLLNDIASEQKPLLFCLDDYHLISNAEIHQSMEFFIEHLPQNFHLLIITREDPPFTLSRLRVKGMVNEIRVSELRFTAEESAAFLNQVANLELDAEDVTALNQRTEGWIAGLQLAALSLQGASDKRAFVANFAGSHRFLTDYLVDEVLSYQPTHIQTFLFRTSLLERFNADLCDQLLGIDNSQEIISTIERDNLFIVPLDDQRDWYRYHHLFNEFLQMHLQEKEPEKISNLYKIAIDWFAAQGLNREALKYALKAADYQRAVDLIEKLAPEIFANDNHMLIIEWTKTLPEDLIKKSAILCTYLAWAAILGQDLRAAEMYLEQAAENAGTLSQGLQGHIYALRADITILQGNLADTMDYAKKALSILPENEYILRARSYSALGNSYSYQGDLKNAKKSFEATIDLAKQTGDLATIIFANNNLVDVLKSRGCHSEAAGIMGESLQMVLAETGSSDHPFNAGTYKQLGVIYREWGKMDQAIEYFKQAIKLAKEWRQNEYLLVSLLEMAETYRLIGDFDEAGKLLWQAKPVAKNISNWVLGLANAYQARLDYSRNDIQSMKAWAEDSGLVDANCEHEFERFPECLPLIRFYLIQNKAEKALELIDKLYQRDSKIGRLGAVCYLLALKVLAHRQLNETEEAKLAFDMLYEIAAPEKRVRIFLEDKEIMIPYLIQMPASAERDRILRGLGETIVARKSTPDQSVLIELLNDRELAVLRQISGGCSNKEIAEQMFLSVNTVRWYASQIYMKLGVKSRTEAVATARELAIL